jgi:hypothetical protein
MTTSDDICQPQLATFIAKIKSCLYYSPRDIQANGEMSVKATKQQGRQLHQFFSDWLIVGQLFLCVIVVYSLSNITPFQRLVIG